MPISSLNRRRLLPTRRRALLAALALPTLARAQAAWPERPVRVIIPYGAAGAGDSAARMTAAALSRAFNQPFVPENRPGGNTLIGAEAVAKSTDGHTLLFCSSPTMSTAPILYGARLPYAPERDFAPVGLVCRTPYFVFVPTNSPAKDLPGLIALAKQRPGALTYASIGNGTVGHMSSELLARTAGFSWTHVPYRAYANIAPDLIAGRLDAVIADLTTFGPLVQAGQARLLAAATAPRSAFRPDVPGMAELGFPGFDGSIWFALFAPAAMPPAVLARVNAALATWLARPETAPTFANNGQQPEHASGEAVRQMIRADAARFGPLIRDLNITAE